MGYKISLPGLLSIQAIADYQRGEALYYIFGRLATESIRHPRRASDCSRRTGSGGPGTRVKRMVRVVYLNRSRNGGGRLLSVKPEASGN